MKKQTGMILGILALAAIVVGVVLMSGPSDAVEALNEDVEEVVADVKDEQAAHELSQTLAVDSSQVNRLSAADSARYVQEKQEMVERLNQSEVKQETPESFLEKYDAFVSKLEADCDTSGLHKWRKRMAYDLVVRSWKDSNGSFKSQAKEISLRRNQALRNCQ